MTSCRATISSQIIHLSDSYIKNIWQLACRVWYLLYTTVYWPYIQYWSLTLLDLLWLCIFNICAINKRNALHSYRAFMFWQPQSTKLPNFRKQFSDIIFTKMAKICFGAIGKQSHISSNLLTFIRLHLFHWTYASPSNTMCNNVLAWFHGVCTLIFMKITIELIIIVIIVFLCECIMCACTRKVRRMGFYAMVV